MNEMVNVDFTSQEGMQAPQKRTTQAEMMVSRQAQEVQVAMLAAKRFPRNQVVAFNNILRACQRMKLAESSMYEYPRGGEKITGPSIRLAEAIAQNWGNIDFGFMELEQSHGVSQVMAYAWDLETNTRQTKLFSVPHFRHTKRGDYPLSDPRDIYEAVANQAARRVRACILGIVPGDVVEAAVERCAKTLREGYEEPLVDRVRKMAMVFEKEFSVTLPMLEKYIGCRSEAFTDNDFVRLKKVYVSLRDGMAKREDYFEVALLVDDAEISDPFGGGKGQDEGQKATDGRTEAKGRKAAMSGREAGNEGN